ESHCLAAAPGGGTSPTPHGGPMPGRHPGVRGVAKEDADLLGVGVLRVDGEPHGGGEALGHQPAPGITALDHLESQRLARLADLCPAYGGVRLRPLLEEEAMDAVEEGAVARVLAGPLLDPLQGLGVVRAELVAHAVEA